MKNFKNLVFIAVAALSLAACGTVETGQRGILTNFGEVQGAAQEPGLVWYNPMTTDLTTMGVQTQKWSSKTVAYTKDVQAASVGFTINYNLRPSAVLTTYKNYGADGWADSVIPQVVYSAIKNTLGQTEAVKGVINDRTTVQGIIATNIRKSLASKGIEVSGFELTDINFSEAFEAAVERKQIAVENAKAAENETVEIREKAQQKVIGATAEAQAMKIKTEALAGNPKLVEYEAVQKWNGELPTYMMGGATPFINLNSK